MGILKKMRSANWRVLLRGFYEYNIARRFRPVPLRELIINVTYHCNSRCVMCNIWQAEKKPELTLEQFDQMLSDPLFRDVERLLLVGGEPTLRKDLPELAETCFKHMPSLQSVSLVTNGLWPARVLEVCEDIAERCAARGIRLTLSVSLDGVAEAHDRMRNIPGAFDKAMETIGGLQKLQERFPFSLGVGCVLCHLNLKHADAFAEWCKGRGIDSGFQLVGFHDTYVANLAERPLLDFDDADRPALYSLMEKMAAEKSLTNTMACYWDDMLHMYRDGRARQSPCPFLTDAVTLDTYGDLRVCETTEVVGNCLGTDSQGDAPCSKLYYGPKMAAMRKSMAQGVCRTCNSGCMVNVGWRKDILKYLRFRLLGS
jgi:MoaA/NifB/PqqE/SkfB family radical SAM enzyme